MSQTLTALEMMASELKQRRDAAFIKECSAAHLACARKMDAVVEAFGKLAR